MMSYPTEEQNPGESPAPMEKGPRDHILFTVIAWIVIVGVVSFLVWMRQPRWQKDRTEQIDRGRLVMQELMGRYIIGAREFLRMSGDNKEQVDQLLAAFPAKDNAEILCLTVLEGELKGPQSALDRLSSIVTERPDEARLRDILTSLYSSYLAGDAHGDSVPKDDRDFLREKLGWFADLALSPPPPPMNPDQLAAAVGGPAAQRLGERVNENTRDHVLGLALQTALALLSGVGAMCFLGVIGFVGLILLIVFASKGKLQDGLGDTVPYGGIYAETFALWLLLFVGFSAVLSLAAPNLDMLEAGGAGMIASLLALFWPILRGVSWRRVREDIGLTMGYAPGMEPAYGIVSYVVCLPLLALGLLLLMLFGAFPGGLGLAANDMPSHPIIEYLLSDDPWIRFKVIFLACVVAPFVEEIVFRGVFYRHLRELTRTFGRGWSFLASAFVVSFIFAVIHPQGWFGVPLLMGIAMGLNIAREWRGTLLPSMIAHGINNGLVLTMAIHAIGN